MTPDQRLSKQPSEPNKPTGVSRKLLVRGSIKGLLAGTSKPELARKAVAAGIRTVMNNPQAIYTAAENALRRTGASAHPSEETVFEPETYDHIEPAENPFAGPTARFHDAIDLTKGIGDDQLRLQKLVEINRLMVDARLIDYSAKLAIEKEDPNLPTQHRVAMAKMHYDDGNTDDGGDLIDDVLKDGGVVTAADYLYIAETKGKQWIQGGKEDPTLDPTKDLERALADLLNQSKPGKEDIKLFAEYAKAYFKATGEIPPSPAFDIVDLLVDEKLASYRPSVTSYDHERTFPEMVPEEVIKIGGDIQAAIEAYLTVGHTEHAQYILEDFKLVAPKTPQTLEIQAQAHAHIARDCLERGKLAMGTHEAHKAIGEIEAMPDGPEKDRLMATVGVDMHGVKAKVLFRQGHNDRIWREFMHATEKIKKSHGDPIAQAEGTRLIGKRFAAIDGIAHELDDAREYLDGCSFTNEGETRRRLAIGYGDLAKDYADYGFLGKAKKELAKMEPLAQGDEGIAAYAKALADVAKAEAIEIRNGELIKNHIIDAIGESGNPVDAQLKSSGVRVWVLEYYIRNTGMKETARLYNLSLDEVEAAHAFYKQHRSLLDARIKQATE